MFTYGNANRRRHETSLRPETDYRIFFVISFTWQITLIKFKPLQILAFTLTPPCVCQLRSVATYYIQLYGDPGLFLYQKAAGVFCQISSSHEDNHHHRPLLSP